MKPNCLKISDLGRVLYWKIQTHPASLYACTQTHPVLTRCNYIVLIIRVFIRKKNIIFRPVKWVYFTQIQPNPMQVLFLNNRKIRSSSKKAHLKLTPSKIRSGYFATLTLYECKILNLIILYPMYFFKTLWSHVIGHLISVHVLIN